MAGVLGLCASRRRFLTIRTCRGKALNLESSISHTGDHVGGVGSPGSLEKMSFTKIDRTPFVNA